MLDTNIISDLIRNPRGRAAKRIARVGENNACTSIIVAAELRYGCAKSGSKRLRKAVEELLGEINVLPFDVPADAEYGAIRSELERAGKPLHESTTLVFFERERFKRAAGRVAAGGLEPLSHVIRMSTVTCMVASPARGRS
jgi:tRNA(fMet)-specific endonuclease VapC